MADQASIFNGHNPPVTPEQNGGSNTPNVQPDAALTNLLMEIKNERGEPKYKTLQDALVALKHSQEYIPQLTSKLSEKDEELNILKTTVGKLSELEKTVQALTQRNDGGQTNPAIISEEQIAALVTKTLSKTQQENLAKENLTSVVDTMQKTYGTEAEKVFYDKAKELGMTVQEFNALAAKTPVAVLKLIGVENKVVNNTTAPNQNAVNTGGFQPTQQSLIGKNSKSALAGATTQELRQESENARKMVEELHAQGKTINDLTNPSVYFKQFS